MLWPCEVTDYQLEGEFSDSDSKAGLVRLGGSCQDVDLGVITGNIGCKDEQLRTV